MLTLHDYVIALQIN